MTAPVAPARSRRVRPAMLLVALAFAALVAMWVYIFFFADTTNPNRVPDRAWAKQAQTTCTGYAKQIEARPKAAAFAKIKPKSEAVRQRAVVGQQVTDLLTRMVADLRAQSPADEVTRAGVIGWLADYDTYVGDRERHLARWAAGEDPPFAETAIDGKPISLGMDDFANANDMSACTVPEDLG